METSRNLRLVSFDGGGMRSFSQLVIMRTIMHQLNYKTKGNPKLPWERFEFMGGSGTGGLIAIMFARLRMSVEEVLDEFDIIAEQVYEEEDIPPSTRTERLRSYMEDLMKRRNYPLDTKLHDETSPESCACFVLSRLSVNTSSKVCLRSYPVQSFPATPITIIDAVLATCAMQPQFDPVVCGKRSRKKEYIGAGIGAHNPIREVITEAELLFGGDTNVASLLSLGNGHPGIITLPSGGGELGLSKVVWDMVNDCTQTAREVEQQIGTAGVYFRFSVEQGMQAKHCDKIADPSWIVAQTESYVEDPVTHNKLGTFVRNIDTAIQPITIIQLKSGQVPNISLQLPSDLEKKQLHVIVTDPDDANLRSLKPANLEYGSHVTECMEGTRQNILAEIRRWMDDVDAPNIFWLKGYPGVGKSAIAASVMEQLRSLGRLGSSFFFQREKANSMTPNALWRVVAYDLARQYPAIKEKIVAALKKDETIMTTPNVDKLFRQLIQDSLVASEETLIGSPLVVIMDALDECGGLDGQRSEHRKNLLRTLKDWSQLPRKFKLFVTSRDESDIGRLFSTTSHQVAEVLTGESVEAQSSEDIEKFLRFRFQEISAAYSRSLRPDWPGSPTIQELTAKSQGLFIWVKVITNFAGSGDPEEQLSRILCGGGTGDMATLYSFILTSFFPDPSETLIESFRSVLGTVILAKIPLSVTSIINLFSLKPTTMERICNGLQAVMDSRETPRIQHQSFVDFLIDPSKCPSAFLIDRKRETQLLTIACLRTMKNVLRFNICDLETSYFRNSDIPNIAARVEEHIPPGLSYSCLFWASHLKDTPFGLGELRYLEDFMNKQFLHWLEVLSLMKRVNAASSMLWTLIDWIQAGGSNETMARDMQKFVATFGSIISQSIPHIYISALPFAPRKSAVSRQYRVDYPQTLKIEMGGQSEWPATQNVFVGHTRGVNSVAFSPDGRRIVSGSEDRTIRVWDAETGEVVTGPLKGHTDRVFSVAFSPDGRQIVSGSSDGTVRVWDAKTGEVVVGPLEGHTRWVVFVTFSPNGRRIVSCFSDGTVRVWDAGTGELVTGPLKGHTHRVRSVAFSPDGRRIVSGSDDGTVRVWDAETGEVVTGPLKGHTDWVFSIAFSPDGRHIVSGSSDGTVRVWDAETGKVVAGPLQGGSVRSVAFSPDSRRIVSGSFDKSIRVWDAKTGKVDAGPLEGHTDQVLSVAFSPDGRRIVSGSKDMTVRVWDAETGEVVAAPLEGHTGEVSSVAFSPGSRRTVSDFYGKTIRMWDVEADEVIPVPLEGHTDSVLSVAFSPDGRRIVSGSSDKTIQVWDAETGKVVAGPLEGHISGVSSVTFSPDGRRIVSGSGDTMVLVWDVEADEVVPVPLEGHTDSVWSVAFSPDGRRIVSGSSDKTIRVWDAETGEVVAGPLEHADWVRSVAFSPDGRRIVSGSNDTGVRVWDTETGEVVAGPLGGHMGDILSVAFSPDGRRIASGSHDTTIRVWDAETGEVVPVPLEGHIGEVWSVAFSPDGKRLMSGSYDQTIRMWDAETGKMVAGPLKRQTGGVLSVAFSPDGGRIVSGSGDNTVRVCSAPMRGPVKSLGTALCFNDTSMIEDGWVLGPNSELLFWVPPDLRTGLYRPGDVLVIGRCLKTKLDMTSFVHGESWARCKG